MSSAATETSISARSVAPAAPDSRALHSSAPSTRRHFRRDAGARSNAAASATRAAYDLTTRREGTTTTRGDPNADPADAAEAGFHASDLREARYVDVPYHSMLPEAEEDAASGRAAERRLAAEIPAECKAESESSPGLGGVPSQATPGMFSYVRQWFVDELGASGAALVARLAAEAPTDECLLMLQHAGGAARRVPRVRRGDAR